MIDDSITNPKSYSENMNLRNILVEGPEEVDLDEEEREEREGWTCFKEYQYKVIKEDFHPYLLKILCNYGPLGGSAVNDPSNGDMWIKEGSNYPVGKNMEELKIEDLFRLRNVGDTEMYQK